MASPYVPPQPPRPAPRSLFGPVVLISLGLILLLATTGYLPKYQMFEIFARWWPLLLILWGVAKLIDHQQARKHGYRTPGMGAGGVFLLILLTLVGLGVTGAYHASAHVNREWFRDNFEIDDDDFAGLFGQRFEYSQDLTATELPKGGDVKLAVERGSIKIGTSPDNQVHVHIAKTLFANDRNEADKLNTENTPTIKVEGNTVNIDASRVKSGRMDFEVAVPKTASVDLMTLRGDINVLDREGKVTTHNSRGSTTLENIIGNTENHLRNGDFTAKNVKGDLQVEGRVDDTEIADVTGMVTMQGDYMGDIALARIGKGVRFQSSRTDMELVKLNGDLSMSHGDLRARDLIGPFRIDTRAKDIHLDDTVGDVRIENEHADIELHPKQLGNVEVTNRSGGIRLIVPGSASFEVNARAERGEVDTDFNLNRTEERRAQTLQGVVNKGGVKVQLNSQNGTISIFKTEGQRANDLSSSKDDDGSDVASEIERRAQEKADKAARKAEQAGRDAQRQADQLQREAEQKAREAQQNH